MSIWYRLQVNKHQHGLYALAHQMLGNQLEAEDVVQDTFIKLWQRREKGGKFEKAWLYKVTRNQCLDIIRRRKHANEYQLAAAAGSDVSPSSVDVVLNDELSGEIGKAINQLDEPYQSLLVMREVNGLSYQVLADALDLSLSQTKVYLHRARKQLKESLEKTYA
ncbi:sigma-70 family RNA polymerase sigma factor [Marinicella sp. S1101]|uniref:RNA polymerase sigma factor n=1 Tax=Marinicella marina TaxID=2996016 RepID=UPI002260F16D|nr:sigma-70 family RNA polymerase sigma factor [Marinicella marina]MCX7552413.1 sigma-70 family RNA polymerase sigma factor [Marinicella marina]MDJ1139288.1 sigma-70 family RNA polymerase sigma factor [Marinicella marina]